MATDLRVVGLDPSLGSFGVAVYEEDGADADAWAIKGRGDGPRRLIQLRDDVAEITDGAALVVVEGYSPGSKCAREVLGEIGGVIRVMLWEQGTPYVVVQPSSMKLYATGRGNSSKAQVHGAAVHRAGREFSTMDASDAWWLLQMALAHLGLPHVPMPAVNRTVLNKIAWPTLPALEVPA